MERPKLLDKSSNYTFRLKQNLAEFLLVRNEQKVAKALYVETVNGT